MTVDIKTENAISPLIARWQQRDDEIDQTIIEWAAANLSPAKSNELIAIIRNSNSAIDVRKELTEFAGSLSVTG
jgi:hypothetical protein